MQQRKLINQTAEKRTDQQKTKRDSGTRAEKHLYVCNEVRKLIATYLKSYF